MTKAIALLAIYAVLFLLTSFVFGDMTWWMPVVQIMEWDPFHRLLFIVGVVMLSLFALPVFAGSRGPR